MWTWSLQVKGSTSFIGTTGRLIKWFFTQAQTCTPITPHFRKLRPEDHELKASPNHQAGACVSAWELGVLYCLSQLQPPQQLHMRVTSFPTP